MQVCQVVAAYDFGNMNSASMDIWSDTLPVESKEGPDTLFYTRKQMSSILSPIFNSLNGVSYDLPEIDVES